VPEGALVVGATEALEGAVCLAIAPGGPCVACGGVAPDWIGLAWVNGSERGWFMSAMRVFPLHLTA
jgi:hypothetical protein